MLANIAVVAICGLVCKSANLLSKNVICTVVVLSQRFTKKYIYKK